MMVINEFINGVTVRGICWCGECIVFVLRYLRSCHDRCTLFFSHCHKCINSVMFFSTEVIVSYCVVLNCIILRIVSTILPSSCM